MGSKWEGKSRKLYGVLIEFSDDSLIVIYSFGGKKSCHYAAVIDGGVINIHFFNNYVNPRK